MPALRIKLPSKITRKLKARGRDKVNRQAGSSLYVEDETLYLHGNGQLIWEVWLDDDPPNQLERIGMYSSKEKALAAVQVLQANQKAGIYGPGDIHVDSYELDRTPE